MLFRLSYVTMALAVGFEPTSCPFRRRVPVHSSHASNWRCDPESNRDRRGCNPQPSHSAITPYWLPLMVLPHRLPVQSRPSYC